MRRKLRSCQKNWIFFNKKTGYWKEDLNKRKRKSRWSRQGLYRLRKIPSVSSLHWSDILHTNVSWTNNIYSLSIYRSRCKVLSFRNSKYICSIFTSALYHLCKRPIFSNSLIHLIHRHQQERWSSFYNFAFIHNYNCIVISNSIEPMSDCYNGVVLESELEGSLNKVISAHVHIRGSLVQDKYAIMTENSTSKTNQLLLAHWECLWLIRNLSQ